MVGGREGDGRENYGVGTERVTTYLIWLVGQSRWVALCVALDTLRRK